MYPVPETRESNFSMRPIGIGIQGLGDLYCILSLPYDDDRAVRLDREIMETIYHGAMEASAELADNLGPYEHFWTSPLAAGRFQFDMWGGSDFLSGRYDWDEMRVRVMRTGVRNSLLTALMPTASTSQILGNSECFEPVQSNIFKRSTLAGEFLVVNRHLMRTLIGLGIWTPELRDRLMTNDGSVQSILEIPEDVRRLYRTVWEIPQRCIIDHAVARGPFVCQSQSMNLFMTQPSFSRLSSALMYAWRCGLKTGMYYLRTQAASEAARVKFDGKYTPPPKQGVDDEEEAGNDEEKRKNVVAAMKCGEEVCEMCSA
jgi:ribonucleoside-diphosphate reductase alpha chain